METQEPQPPSKVSQKRKRKGILIISGISAVALAASIWWYFSHPSAMAVAHKWVLALLKNDWETLYQMMPARDIEINGWTSTQFSELAESLASRFPLQGATYQLTELPPPEKTTRKVSTGKGGFMYEMTIPSEYKFNPANQAGFLVKIICPAGSEQKIASFFLLLRRARGGIWQVDGVETFQALIALYGDRNQGIKQLRDSMKTSHLHEIRSLDGTWRISLDQDDPP